MTELVIASHSSDLQIENSGSAERSRAAEAQMRCLEIEIPRNNEAIARNKKEKGR